MILARYQELSDVYSKFQNDPLFLNLFHRAVTFWLGWHFIHNQRLARSLAPYLASYCKIESLVNETPHWRAHPFAYIIVSEKWIRFPLKYFLIISFLFENKDIVKDNWKALWWNLIFKHPLPFVSIKNICEIKYCWCINCQSVTAILLKVWSVTDNMNITMEFIRNANSWLPWELQRQNLWDLGPGISL